MKRRPLLAVSRRRLLAAGGAVIVSFAWRRAVGAENLEETGAGEGKVAAPPLPGNLEQAPWLDAWIRIDAQGMVTVFTGKVELGQGLKTALVQLAAEELVIPPERVTLVTADTARTVDEGYTAGSHSMQDSGTAGKRRIG